MNSTHRLVNLFLRLISLGGKFILTLYMGRFFDLEELGTYGLVFGAVMLLTSVLGQELGFIVRRELVGIPHVDALHKIRDQTIWHGLNYGLLCVIIAVLIAVQAFGISPKYYIYTLCLSICENLGAMTCNNLNLLSMQIRSNLALFIRAASWIPVAILISWLSPEHRNTDTVLICWCVGSALSLAVPLWTWRNWGWAEVMKRPINWPWVKQGLKKSKFIWLGVIGSMGGGYANRYIVNMYLDLSFVGVLTFYCSFTNAIWSLIDSGVVAFAGPRLVALFKHKDHEGFHREALHACWQTAFGAGVFALAVGYALPFLGTLLGRPEFAAESPTLWLLLGETWILSLDGVLGAVLFAKHLDKPIWQGGLLYLIPSLLGNLYFVRMFGLVGVGYSAILSSGFLFFWRLYFIAHHTHKAAKHSH